MSYFWTATGGVAGGIILTIFFFKTIDSVYRKVNQQYINLHTKLDALINKVETKL